MEFSIPDFPADPAGQAAYLASLFVSICGATLLVFPGFTGRLAGFGSKPARPGGLGAARTAGGWLAGFSVGVFILAQPMPYAILALALASGAFGRLVSMLSDGSTTALNVLFFLAQVILAFLLSLQIGSAFSEAGTFLMPTGPEAAATFVVCILLAILGVAFMFAPRLVAAVMGLEFEKRQAMAFMRSSGAFTLCVGGASAYLAGMAESLFTGMLFTHMAVLAGLVVASLGGILALIFNRGNMLTNAVSIFLTLGMGVIILWSMMNML